MRIPILALLLVCAEAIAAPELLTGDGLEPLPTDTKPIRYHIAVTPDVAAGRFIAHADLEFEVVNPTRRIVVNALELDITSARLRDGAAAEIIRDDARQRVIFQMPKQLSRGAHTLAVDYSGRIHDNIGGIFRVRYPTTEGVEKQMLFTYLCCIGTARLFAPIWDQPDLKAVFDLELTIPRGLTAVSNMPISRRTDVDEARERVEFASTPRMSTYLLFFSVGEFDRITRRLGTTELGVVLQKGHGEQGRFALDATADAVDYYNRYFDTHYPLPKLDSVGMPGAARFGAMENWGAILYFEPYMVIDSALSTEADAQTVYSIVTHEVAHQWFGNLVTMEWWDDLWLNEGFASWMASKIADRNHPEWKMWVHAADSRESGIRLDARSTTHPIIRKVKNLEEAELAFDDITYEKGSAVIRMIEGWAGPEAFRAAIRAHIRNHAYGNAVTDDLWKELEKTSPRAVTAIARDFTTQSGVPLIEVLSTRCAPDEKSTTVTLRQRQFGLDEPSKGQRLWHVPVIAGVVGEKHVARAIVRGSQPARLEVPGCGPIKVNLGETGYFRTQYDEASLAALRDRFAQLSVADQVGLMKDVRGLADGGYISLATYFDIADSLPADADPLAILDYARTVQDLTQLYQGMPSEQAFRAFASRRFASLLQRTGWTARPGEAANVGLLRNTLIETLALLDDQATIAEARRRFEGFPRDSTLVPGPIRKSLVAAVGAGADSATFDDFIARAGRATDSAGQRLYLMSLGAANDPDIARRALQLCFTDDVPPQLFETMFREVAKRHPQLALDVAMQNFDAIQLRSAGHGGKFMAIIAGNGIDAAFAKAYARFAAAKLGNDAKESTTRAKALILFRDQLRRRELPQVDAWLQRH
jgi:aminopeptidase N